MKRRVRTCTGERAISKDLEKINCCLRKAERLVQGKARGKVLIKACRALAFCSQQSYGGWFPGSPLSQRYSSPCPAFLQAPACTKSWSSHLWLGSYCAPLKGEGDGAWTCPSHRNALIRKATLAHLYSPTCLQPLFMGMQMGVTQVGFSFFFQHLTAAHCACSLDQAPDCQQHASGVQAAGRQGQVGIPTQTTGL